MAGSLASMMYWAVRTTHYGCQIVAIPSGDAASQDPLEGAAVELIENLRSHEKYFQTPGGGKGVVVPSSQLCWCVWTMIDP